MIFDEFFKGLDTNLLPPTIYSILNSICNYGKEESERISTYNLAKNGRSQIFDFDYPLSSVISKEYFETMILNHFLMRRIGCETITNFKIKLNVKLNEIMPNYNILFNSINDWNLFKDGEITVHELESLATNESNNKIDSNIENTSNSVTDNRFSDTPQNEIENVKDGSYVSDYTLNQVENTGNNISSSTGNTSGNNTNKLTETTTRNIADKISVYKNFIESRQNIFTMIFKDLESLFYQIV